MSRDALIAKVAGDNFEKPTEDAKLVSMGSTQEIRTIITKHFPEIKWQNDGRGYFASESGSLEFLLIGKTDAGHNFQALKDGDSVESIGVSARGGGDPVGSITQFAIHNRWSVSDAQEGQWMDLKNISKKSWEEFVGYRDKVSNPAGPAQDSSSAYSGSISLNLIISIAFFILIGLGIRYISKHD